MANDGQDEEAAHVPRQEAWWEDAAAAQARLDEWDAKTSTIWGDKRCCALCGVGALGTTDFYQLRLQRPPQTEDGQLAPAPPALLLNSLTGSASVSADGQWWQCKTCRGNRAFAKDHNVSFRHEYFQQLSRCLPSALSQLGFLDVHLDIERRMSGCIGIPTNECLLDGPLIRWNEAGPDSMNMKMTACLLRSIPPLFFSALVTQGLLHNHTSPTTARRSPATPTAIYIHNLVSSSLPPL
jgi:hypothetical protein